jgi:predicted dehydrogenase
MIRIGLIGCGEHSDSGHAIPLARYQAAHSDEIMLAAACDLRLERAREFCGKYGFLAAYQSVDEMLREENLDGCITVVPAERISELGTKLLKLGVPCVVEKPLGSSLAEVNALQDSAASTGTLNMVSVNRRFMPFLIRALNWARSAGSLRYVRCTLARHARTEPEFLWATAIHAVDTLRFIAGDVLTFDLHTMAMPETSAVWYAVDFQFKNGTSGRIDVLPTSGMGEETYDLFGHNFRATVTCPFGPRLGWRGFRDGRQVADEVAGNEPEDVVNGCYDEAAEFIRAVRSKSAPQPSIADIVPSVTLCLAMAEAARTNAGK